MGTPSTPSSTTTNSTNTPWSGAAQYLTGGGTSGNGVYGDVADYAKKYSSLTPQQTKLVAGQQTTLNGRPAIANSLYKGSTDLGNSILKGNYNTNYGPVANSVAGQATNGQAVAGQATNGQAVAGQATNGQATAGYSDLQRGMANFGGNDPRDAISRALSGDVNNDVVGSMNQANINRSMQGYNDAMINMGQTVLPSINNDSFASGQYGGSRQGVAQGLAIQGAERNARDLGIAAMDSGNLLYGNAYNAAQDRSSSTANNLAGLASDNEQFNAGQTTQNNQYNNSLDADTSRFNAEQTTQNNQYNNTLDANTSQFNAGQTTQNNQYNNTLDANTSQFNAGQTTQNNQFNADLGIQNNTQGMAQNAQNLGNMTTGNEIKTNAATDLFNNQDATYAKKQNLANTPQQQALDMLNLRLNSVSPGAAMGGSSSQTDPLYSNTFGQAAGLASSVGGLVKAFK
jgi:hypothetical protein